MPSSNLVRNDTPFVETEYARYAPEKIFLMTKIARTGPKLLKEQPLPVARLLISRGLSALRTTLELGSYGND